MLICFKGRRVRVAHHAYNASDRGKTGRIVRPDYHEEPPREHIIELDERGPLGEILRIVVRESDLEALEQVQIGGY